MKPFLLNYDFHLSVICHLYRNTVLYIYPDYVHIVTYTITFYYYKQD